MSVALIDGLRAITPELINRLDEEQCEELYAKVAELHHDSVDQKCAKVVSSFTSGPLYWLTSHTKTENPNYERQGLPYKNPFPRKEYFVPLFQEFLTYDRLFVPKTREMITSWSTVGYATWRAQWFSWDCIFQTASVTKVTELVDYAAQLWRNQPEWLKERHPLSRKEPTQQALEFSSGGRVMAIPSGEEKIRLYHPTLLVLDEAAFLPECEQCYNAAVPVTRQIIAISTANPGFFGNECTL